jgi:hypothetical protein
MDDGYEKTTRQLDKINTRKGAGWAMGILGALSESGMYSYGVKEVISYGGLAGFWVVVWLIARQGQGGGKQGKTTYWQRVNKK